MKKVLAFLLCTMISMGAMAQQLSNWSIGSKYMNSSGSGYDTWIIGTFTSNETDYFPDYFNNYEVAAFVANEEYPRATGFVTVSPQSGVYQVTLQVKGNIDPGDDDEGKPITFLVYNGNTGCVYNLASSLDITWQAEAPTFRPAFTLTAVTSVTLQPITMNVGESVDLTDYITKVPANGSMPINFEFSWDLGNFGTYAEINGNILTALQPTTTEDVEYSMTIPYWANGTVHINPAVSGFTVFHAPGTNGKDTLRFEPIPTNATFNATAINVGIEHETCPTGWTDVTISNRNNGTNFIEVIYSTLLPGKYFVSLNSGQTVYTLYDGNSQDVNNPDAFSDFTVPMTYSFTSGWQWRSNYYGNMTNCYDEFFNASFLNSFTEARAQNKLLINDPSWGLFSATGSFILEPAQCYKILMSSAAATTMTYGHLIENNEYINLNYRWTWIGSPYLYDRLLSNALVDGSNINSGTRIVSKSDGFAEWDGSKWTGTLTVIKKGQGYMVYSPGTNKKLRFESEFSMPQSDETPAGARSFYESVWRYDHAQFANNMSMIAELKGVDNINHYTVGAFVGDECRGEGTVVDGKLFITVHGNSNEQVTFRLHNELTDEFFDINETMKFQQSAGSLTAPVALSMAAGTTGITQFGNDGRPVGEAYDLMGRKNLNAKLTIQRMANGKMRKVVE